MDRFKDRFSLDYLRGGSSSSSSEGSRGLPSLSPFGVPSAAEALPPARGPALAAQSTEDALIVYGRPVMDALAKANGHTRRVFDLSRDIGVRVDVLYPVVEYLTSKGFVVKTEHDKLGNDEIQLTGPSARPVLTRSFDAHAAESPTSRDRKSDRSSDSDIA